MVLRPSRVLKKLRAGGLVSCVKLNLADPRVAEIAAMSGVDCIWSDLEHVPNTLHDIANQIRAAKTRDVDTVVRVPRGSTSDLLYPLEMDAAGIMIPHVMNLADATDVRNRVRFHPLGKRPLDGGNADGAYCQVSLEHYLKHANENRLVILQIEDFEPLSDLNAIAALPGIDMLFFGPGDFTQSLGVPGQFNDPRVREARRMVARAAIENGKYAGTVASPQTISECYEEGYRFISMGADVVALGTYFQGNLRHFAALEASADGQPAPEVSIYPVEKRAGILSTPKRN